MRQPLLPRHYRRHPETKNHSNNGVHNGNGGSNGFNHKPVSDPHEHNGIKKHTNSLPNFNPPNKIRFTLHSKRQIIPSNKNEKNGDRNVGKVRNTIFNGSRKEYNRGYNGNGSVQKNILVETSGRPLSMLLDRDPREAMKRLVSELKNESDPIIRKNAISKLKELGETGYEILKTVQPKSETENESKENGDDQ